MKWISIKERLPETKPEEDFFVSEKVLVLAGGDVVSAHYEKHGPFDGEGPWGNWWDHWCQDLIGEGVVTHWMPLPEPPTDEDK